MDAKDVQFIPMDKYDLDRKGTFVKTRIYYGVTEIARDLLARWGNGIAIPAGVNPIGQPLFTTLTPEQLAKRACDAAECLMSEFLTRGWCVDVPPPVPVDDTPKDAGWDHGSCAEHDEIIHDVPADPEAKAQLITDIIPTKPLVDVNRGEM